MYKYICVSGSELRHIRYLIKLVQDLNFLVLIVQCLMVYIPPQAAGKPSKQSTLINKTIYSCMCLAQFTISNLEYMASGQ